MGVHQVQPGCKSVRHPTHRASRRWPPFRLGPESALEGRKITAASSSSSSSSSLIPTVKLVCDAVFRSFPPPPPAPLLSLSLRSRRHSAQLRPLQMGRLQFTPHYCRAGLTSTFTKACRKGSSLEFKTFQHRPTALQHGRAL